MDKGYHPDRDSKYPVQVDIDAAWAKEAEERIDAFERGDIGSTPAEEVFKDIDQQDRS